MSDFNCAYPISVFSYWTQHSCAQIFETTAFTFPRLSEYFFLFFMTYLFETPVYWLLLRKQFSFKKILRISLILNLATHPAVIYGIPRIVTFFGGHEGHCTLIAEAFAPLVEATLLTLIWQVRPMRAVLSSVSANLFSWLFGGWVLIKFIL